MKPSEFQTTIENQFDYICKVAMEDERKDYKQLSHPSIPSSDRPFFLNLYEEKQDYNYAASRALQKTMMKNMLLYGSHIYDGIILIKKMIPPKLRKKIKTLLCEKI